MARRDRSGWTPDYSDPDVGSASDASNVLLAALCLLGFVFLCLIGAGL